jgi:hypothetical protein
VRRQKIAYVFYSFGGTPRDAYSVNSSKIGDFHTFASPSRPRSLQSGPGAGLVPRIGPPRHANQTLSGIIGVCSPGTRGALALTRVLGRESPRALYVHCHQVQAPTRREVQWLESTQPLAHMRRLLLRKIPILFPFCRRKYHRDERNAPREWRGAGPAEWGREPARLQEGGEGPEVQGAEDSLQAGRGYGIVRHARHRVHPAN